MAGCPPCQGFSSLRKKNKKRSSKIQGTILSWNIIEWVKELQPICIMLENVPGIENYTLFKRVFSQLKKLGYHPQYRVVNVADYGVPQRRKRLVMTAHFLAISLFQMEIQLFEPSEITLEILRASKKQPTLFTVDTLTILIRLWKGYGSHLSMGAADVICLMHILLNVTARKALDSMMYMVDFDGMMFPQQLREDA